MAKIKDYGMGSDLERAFDTQLIAVGPDIPEPAIEYTFAPPRKWRFDRAWVEQKVAVELNGGNKGIAVRCHNCGVTVRGQSADGTPGRELRIPGNHGRVDVFNSDMEKFNAAVLRGWSVLQFGHDDVYGNPFDMVDKIRKTLESKPVQKVKTNLSARETEVIHLIAAGFTSEEVAARLSCSPNTIINHVDSIMGKLSALNRTHAVALAAACGLLDWTLVPWAEELTVTDWLGGLDK